MRITKKDLYELVNRLNTLTGKTDEIYRYENDRIVGDIAGTYVLNCAYGLYGLDQMAESGGTGQSTVFNYNKPRELYALISAYMLGMRVDV